MTRPVVAYQNLGGSASLSNTAMNAVLGRLAFAANVHNHAPDDPNSGFAAAVVPWGILSPLYAKHGPGGSDPSNDYATAYANAAAVPGDPTGTALDPTTAIQPASGVITNIHAVMGALNLLAGRASTTNWVTNPFPTTLSLAQINPAAAQSGTLNVTGTITGLQYVSTAPQGTAPLQVTSTTAVPNLNADMVDGLHATATYGAGNAGKILALDANGFVPLDALEYDATEAVTLDTLAGGTSTLRATVDRLRWSINSMATAFGASYGWLNPPSAAVAGIATPGAASMGGVVTFSGTGGIGVAQSAGQVVISFNGTAPASGQSLTPSDLLLDWVVSGLGLSYTPAAGAAITATPSSTGGSLAAGVYRVQWAYTGTNGAGVASAEQTVTVAGTGAGSIAFTVPAAPTGAGAGVSASGVIIYVTAAGGASGTETAQLTNVGFGTVQTLTAITGGGSPPAASNLTATEATGWAYVNGTRQTNAAAAVLTFPASQTSYVDWTGTAFSVNQTAGGPAAGSIRLWSVVTSAAGVTSAADLRPLNVSLTSAGGIRWLSGGTQIGSLSAAGLLTANGAQFNGPVTVQNGAALTGYTIGGSAYVQAAGSVIGTTSVIAGAGSNQSALGVADASGNPPVVLNGQYATNWNKYLNADILDNWHAGAFVNFQDMFYNSVINGLTLYAAPMPSGPATITSASTGGTLAAGTYYFEYTYVSVVTPMSGQPSIEGKAYEQTVTIPAGTATNLLTITIPAPPAGLGITSANLYLTAVGGASGTEKFQRSTTTFGAAVQITSYSSTGSGPLPGALNGSSGAAMTGGAFQIGGNPSTGAAPQAGKYVYTANPANMWLYQTGMPAYSNQDVYVQMTPDNSQPLANPDASYSLIPVSPIGGTAPAPQQLGAMNVWKITVDANALVTAVTAVTPLGWSMNQPLTVPSLALSGLLTGAGGFSTPAAYTGTPAVQSGTTAAAAPFQIRPTVNGANVRVSVLSLYDTAGAVVGAIRYATGGNFVVSVKGGTFLNWDQSLSYGTSVGANGGTWFGDGNGNQVGVIDSVGNGNLHALTLQGTAASSGAQLGLADTTVSQATPNKYIRSSGGSLQVLNSAGNTVIWSMDDAGNHSHGFYAKMSPVSRRPIGSTVFAVGTHGPYGPVAGVPLAAQAVWAHVMVQDQAAAFTVFTFYSWSGGDTGTGTWYTGPIASSASGQAYSQYMLIPLDANGQFGFHNYTALTMIIDVYGYLM